MASIFGFWGVQMKRWQRSWAGVGDWRGDFLVLGVFEGVSQAAKRNSEKGPAGR